MAKQIYEVEFEHEGAWVFFTQHIFENSARDDADFLQSHVGVASRYRLRTEEEELALQERDRKRCK
jgi:hypothetical protein